MPLLAFKPYWVMIPNSFSIFSTEISAESTRKALMYISFLSCFSLLFISLTLDFLFRIGIQCAIWAKYGDFFLNLGSLQLFLLYVRSFFSVLCCLVTYFSGPFICIVSRTTKRENFEVRYLFFSLVFNFHALFSDSLVYSRNSTQRY